MISATMFRDSTKQELTEEQEQLKREIYERMNPRRRKFIDRIGYDFTVFAAHDACEADRLRLVGNDEHIGLEIADVSI